MRSHALARLSVLTLPTALVLLAACASGEPHTASSVVYPRAERGEHADDYHGTVVADPYRWLEDSDSSATRAWIEAQNALTFDYLAGIDGREEIRERLTELWNYERYGVPREKGGRYFYTRNDGLQNQSVLFVQEGLDGEPRELLDPNTLSEDGTVALAGWAPSEDGRWLAYAVADGGSDWRVWRVRDVDSGADTGDLVRWTKFSGAAWTHDHQGFYYSRYPEPEGDALQSVNEHNRIYYHRLGTPQEEDTLVFEMPEQPRWGFSPRVTDDGRWLVISGSRGTERKNRVWFQDLAAGGAVTPLVADFFAQFQLVGNDGSTWYFRTDFDAPKGRVLAVDVAHPAPSPWAQVIPERADALRSVAHRNGRLVASYLHDAYSDVRVYSTTGAELGALELTEGHATVGGFSGSADSAEAFCTVTSFSRPSTVYRVDLDAARAEVWRELDLRFEPDDYVSEQVWYTSADGTQVPMFVVRKKSTRAQGGHPTLLYGYGGFNIALTPSFSVTNLAWMEMGGVYALANLRGGGEFGSEWHRAGTVHSKQNVFDDFIAAAEWLVNEGWTSPEQLAIRGGSNGGLLVGACMTQRPELFGACLPAVGVMDMLRYHEFTIGWAWASDYGTSADPDEFATLYAYSPLHNLEPGTAYPATMVTTGDHDDRVVPAHSFKFAAALQAAQAGPEPCLIRIETRAGHGAGKPTSKRIEEAADQLAFLVAELGVD